VPKNKKIAVKLKEKSPLLGGVTGKPAPRTGGVTPGLGGTRD